MTRVLLLAVVVVLAAGVVSGAGTPIRDATLRREGCGI